MKTIIIGIAMMLSANIALCQAPLKISPEGNKLRAFYLKQDVEHLWVAGHHINWETGEPDRPNAVKSIRTHCSAFVASACKQKGIYILRPPDHKQGLLASAQYDWLSSEDAFREGWRQIRDSVYATAQQLADRGFIVTAVYKNPDPKKPGHIALVIPSERSADQLYREGPMMIQAGSINCNEVPLREGFRHHITDWANATSYIMFFYNEHCR